MKRNILIEKEKAEKAAKEKGKSAIEFVDEVSSNFKELMKKLEITNKNRRKKTLSRRRSKGRKILSTYFLV